VQLVSAASKSGAKSRAASHARSSTSNTIPTSRRPSRYRRSLPNAASRSQPEWRGSGSTLPAAAARKAARPDLADRPARRINSAAKYGRSVPPVGEGRSLALGEIDHWSQSRGPKKSWAWRRSHWTRKSPPADKAGGCHPVISAVQLL